MHYFKSYSNSTSAEKNSMLNSGFYVKHDLFIKDGYGAFMISLPERIRNLNHFHIYDSFYKCDDYELLYYLEQNEDYKFMIGPGIPNKEGKIVGNGLYCTNYEELINGNQKRK